MKIEIRTEEAAISERSLQRVIDELQAENADLRERYECKSDALNAAMIEIDYLTKENDRLREALGKINYQSYIKAPDREMDQYYERISREALEWEEE